MLKGTRMPQAGGPPLIKHGVALVQEVDLAALGDAGDAGAHANLHLAAGARDGKSQAPGERAYRVGPAEREWPGFTTVAPVLQQQEQAWLAAEPQACTQSAFVAAALKSASCGAPLYGRGAGPGPGLASCG